MPSPLSFEIVGNEEEISLYLSCSESAGQLVETAFQAEYAEGYLEKAKPSWLGAKVSFMEIFPPPPYHHLFTDPTELVQSPLNSYIQALKQIPAPQKGFIQVLIQAARHPWHENVRLLTDLEFLSKSIQPGNRSTTLIQQTPSVEMHQLGHTLEQKAHPDKPFYSVIVRLGITGETGPVQPELLSGFLSLLRHGGKALQIIPPHHIDDRFKAYEKRRMIQQLQTYRHGFLMNSNELVSLLHIPSSNVLKENFPQHPVLDILPANPFITLSTRGIYMGTSIQNGRKVPALLSSEERSKNVHIIGKPGTGKTTLLENMILEDIGKGYGLAFIDPHGDAIKRLLRLIPEDQISRVIYLDFGDPSWIPIWNPLWGHEGPATLRVADDLVNAIRSTIHITQWGDRLEHLLRHGFYALMTHGDASIIDMLHLFHQGHSSKHQSERIQIINEIISKLDNPAAEMFWERDYSSYKREEFSSTHHKLSKLLLASETISLMLSQSQNAVDIKECLEKRKVLLLDLSSVGDDARKVLGKFLLSSLFHTALYRSNLLPEDRELFTIYCDEAHKLTTHSLGDMLVESRKYGISLVLAHQYLNQFPQAQIDALSSAGTSVIFNIDIQDAMHLSKDLKEMAIYDDIIDLEVGEAIMKMGTHILKIKPDPPAPVGSDGFMNRIVSQSRAQYCKPVAQVKRELRERESDYGPENALLESDRELIRRIIAEGDFTLDYF
ncbi:MAG: type IV secretion system DNA-binding domain-containing protein [Candidatus Marinimicrobia bacterium]|nr:type IV secretion system DNA-binding domain-containing protein [Candidatus Neomarinimicrobiota bacterium]MCF7850557.1 type IV secretion system DNA-binding domain-containing protein [Candidatus Neomarinimicrobiota bacterium]